MAERNYGIGSTTNFRRASMNLKGEKSIQLALEIEKVESAKQKHNRLYEVKFCSECGIRLFTFSDDNKCSLCKMERIS